MRAARMTRSKLYYKREQGREPHGAAGVQETEELEGEGAWMLLRRAGLG